MKKVRRFCRAFFSVLRGVESVLRACRGFREGCFLEKAPPRTPPQKLPNMEVLSRDSHKLSAKSRNSFLIVTHGAFLTRVPSRAEQSYQTSHLLFWCFSLIPQLPTTSLTTNIAMLPPTLLLSAISLTNNAAVRPLISDRSTQMLLWSICLQDRQNQKKWRCRSSSDLVLNTILKPIPRFKRKSTKQYS